MDDTVSIAEVRRKLSFILRGASEGQSYVVVSNGRPVARIVPADRQDFFPTRAQRCCRGSRNSR